VCSALSFRERHAATTLQGPRVRCRRPYQTHGLLLALRRLGDSCQARENEAPGPLGYPTHGHDQHNQYSQLGQVCALSALRNAAHGHSIPIRTKLREVFGAVAVFRSPSLARSPCASLASSR